MLKLPISISGLTQGEYFKTYDEFISSSEVKLLLKSVMHFMHNRNTEIKTTKAMEFGTMIHNYILEGKEPACLPALDLRTKAGKAEKALFIEENKGRNIVSADDYVAALEIKKNIFADYRAENLLDFSGGEAEKSFFWEDKKTGLNLKAKTDYIHNSGEYIVDLKTTIDASESSFLKSIINFNYDLSAAMYVDGVEAVTGIRPDFYFVAVENKAPFAVNVFKMSEEDLQNGRSLYRYALKKLLDYYEDQEEYGYGNEIIETNLPPWASWERRI